MLNTNELQPYIESATSVNVTPRKLNPLFNQDDLPSGSCGPDVNLASPNINELLPYIETPTSSVSVTPRELMNNPLFNHFWLRFWPWQRFALSGVELVLTVAVHAVTCISLVTMAFCCHLMTSESSG